QFDGDEGVFPANVRGEEGPILGLSAHGRPGPPEAVAAAQAGPDRVADDRIQAGEEVGTEEKQDLPKDKQAEGDTCQRPPRRQRPPAFAHGLAPCGWLTCKFAALAKASWTCRKASMSFFSACSICLKICWILTHFPAGGRPPCSTSWTISANWAWTIFS